MTFICSKYLPQIDLSKFSNYNKVERIFSKKINSIDDVEIFGSANSTHFLYDNKITAIEHIDIYNDKILVLTNKEANYLLNFSLKNNVEILIFENMYPFFNDIKYVNIEKNYEILKKKINFLVKKNIPLKKFSTIYSNHYLHKVERKIRNKSKLDQAFRLYPLSGYQEVFKLKEARLDRSIICLDYNSMYPSVLDQYYFDPKYLEYKKINKVVKNLNEIPNGIHHVILHKCKNDFFKKYNYFQYINKDIKHSFIIEDKPIEILLFSDEIKFLFDFFEEIYIIDSIISNKLIKHPLHKEAERLYNQRLSFKKDNNKTLAALNKLKLTLLHSCTNQRKFKNIKIKNKIDILNLISSYYDIPNEECDFFLEYFIKKGIIKFKKNKKYEVEILDTTSAYNIYSISAHIIAKSKIKLMQTIMSFLSFRDLEICYVNIDCIHLSVKKKDVELFFNNFKNIIGEKMGQLKIENIATKGYWLDVGRYWLYNNNSLITHKNILFNTPYLNQPYMKFRKIKKISKFDGFHYISEYSLNITNCINMKKMAIEMDDHINLYRFNQNQLILNTEYKGNLVKNIQRNNPIYTKILNEIFD
ncbi:hypothetical protein [Acinetobacter indicus]|uniref:hypothetical protein n=1 Tax=Acinetobacter indicus TaxID=756892 RepID=UPI000CEC0CEF|nr:hypothetical protein [Acinetobacter indicus]